MLIFSHLLSSLPQTQPTYPNYTLPPAQLPLFASGAGSSTSSLTLIIVPTGSSPTSDGLDNSLCAIRTANISTGGIASARNAVLNRSQPHWMRLGGEEGLRSAWGAGDLVAGGSNYTAWTLDEAKGELSRPVWFATKQGQLPRFESSVTTCDKLTRQLASHAPSYFPLLSAHPLRTPPHYPSIRPALHIPSRPSLPISPTSSLPISTLYLPPFFPPHAAGTATPSPRAVQTATRHTATGCAASSFLAAPAESIRLPIRRLRSPVVRLTRREYRVSYWAGIRGMTSSYPVYQLVMPSIGRVR